MSSRDDHRIPGYSDEDMRALAVLVRCQLDLNRSAIELARMIAAERTLSQPQPEPRKRGRHRYVRIEHPERGVVLADVINDVTGEVRHLRITKSADGTVTAEELD
jgi:hypothetical protein